MAAPRLTGFPPLADRNARVLLLGSMPGVASLAAGRYYAHPRNDFWRIMRALLGLPEGVSYARQSRALTGAGIALWDVVHSCVRSGSLDTAIERASVRINDFRGFFAAHPGLRLICFNGTTAERLYLRRVAGEAYAPQVPLVRLPSTSPAHAARNFATKQAIWREALAVELAGRRNGQARTQASARPSASTASTSRRRSSSRVR